MLIVDLDGLPCNFYLIGERCRCYRNLVQSLREENFEYGIEIFIICAFCIKALLLHCNYKNWDDVNFLNKPLPKNFVNKSMNWFNDSI